MTDRIYTKKMATWRNRALFVVSVLSIAVAVPAVYLWWIVAGTAKGAADGFRKVWSDMRAIPGTLRAMALLVTTGRDLYKEDAEEQRKRFFGSLPRRRKEQGK